MCKFNKFALSISLFCTLAQVSNLSAQTIPPEEVSDFRLIQRMKESSVDREIFDREIKEEFEKLVSEELASSEVDAELINADVDPTKIEGSVTFDFCGDTQDPTNQATKACPKGWTNKDSVTQQHPNEYLSTCDVNSAMAKMKEQCEAKNTGKTCTVKDTTQPKGMFMSYAIKCFNDKGRALNPAQITISGTWLCVCK